MNSRADSLFAHDYPNSDAEALTSGALRCFHCGLRVATDMHFEVEIDRQKRRMCCVGCESVAQTILAAGLVDFYRHRIGFSEQLDPSTLLLDDAPSKVSEPTFGHASVTTVPNASGATASELHLYLSGLRCAACVWLAERTLANLPGTISTTINLTTQSARIRFDANALHTAGIIDALARVGLGAEPAEHEARLIARKHQRRTQLLEFGVAALCMMQVMMLVVPIYLADAGDVSREAKQLMGWTAWLLTLPVLMFSARPIFVNAFRTAFHTASSGYIGMDVPVALALLLTFIASTVALVTDSGQHYFDAITMFVFLLLGARWLESSIRLRTAESIDRLANARPLVCERLTDYPASESAVTVRADHLRLGDVISIRPGECVPADAVILRGESEIDEALMTGESRPVARGVGDVVIGGTLNTGSPLLARVTAAGEQTLLSRLGKMVESSLMYRPAFQGVAERAARWIAPITLLLAAGAAIVWWQIDAGRAAEIAIAVLAITCPCAFALAAPTALASTLSRMTGDGLLIARGHLIETMATATDVVFDKTGTLTTGKMRIAAIHCKCSQLAHALRIAVCMERGATHPVAAAINTYALDYFGSAEGAAEYPVAAALTTLAGCGIEAQVNGRTYRLGKPDFAVPPVMRAQLVATSLPRDETHIALCSSDGAHPALFALFSLSDPLRADAQSCVRRLQSGGLNVHLLSGDAEQVVATCAGQLGITPANSHSAQTPDQKQAYVAALVRSGARVVAVGDGVNDAPMLAAANGSIGLAQGATLTRLTADAVLAANRGQLLTTLADAVDTSRKTQRVIRQNLQWALVYNVVAVPLALLGLVTPLIAAFGMALSSLIVVLNASRLRATPRRLVAVVPVVPARTVEG